MALVLVQDYISKSIALLDFKTHSVSQDLFSALVFTSRVFQPLRSPHFGKVHNSSLGCTGMFKSSLLHAQVLRQVLAARIQADHPQHDVAYRVFFPTVDDKF